MQRGYTSQRLGISVKVLAALEPNQACFLSSGVRTGSLQPEESGS